MYFQTVLVAKDTNVHTLGAMKPRLKILFIFFLKKKSLFLSVQFKMFQSWSYCSSLTAIAFCMPKAQLPWSTAADSLLRAPDPQDRGSFHRKMDTVTYVFGLTSPVYNSATAMKFNYLQQEFQNKLGPVPKMRSLNQTFTGFLVQTLKSNYLYKNSQIF